MMIIRPVIQDDLAALRELAAKTGVGFTSLQDNEEQLRARVERMIGTWQGKLPLSEQGYLFVLEDTEVSKVVGICGIEAAIGLNEAWYNYRVGTLVHASKALDIYSQMPTLFLSNDHTGHSELCTLFLDPSYRHNKNGQLLSKSRFLFLATFPDRFGCKLIAEMRGVSDEQGCSPFWESLGRHFFSMDFAQADYLTGIGQKSFIAELMPKHPLYVNFLSEEAQAVIGQVHPDTVPARKILEAEGMRYEGYVDIFDAGPTVEAYIQDLRIVREIRSWLVEIVENSSGSANTFYLIGNENFCDYRVISGTPEFSETHIRLTPHQADRLKVGAGDTVRAVTLFAQETAS
jgi:arginine N-succinyltransferase